MAKHIDAKILAKYVKAKYRLHPQMQEWYKAYGLLLKGYYRRIDFIEDSKGLGEKKKFQYPRKPTLVPKPNVHISTKQYVLQGHIFYAKNLDDQKILDAFGYYLYNLKDSQWVRSIYKPDGTKINKRRKKKVVERVKELLDNPKRLLIARKILNKERLLKKQKYK